MNSRLSARRISQAGIALILGGLAFIPAVPLHSQTNRPIRSMEMPHDGKPYNLLPEPKTNQRTAKGRACPDYSSRNSSGVQRMHIAAFAYHLRNGSKTRHIVLYFEDIPTDGPKRAESMIIPADDDYDNKHFSKINESYDWDVLFQNVLRIAKDWRAAGVPTETKYSTYGASSMENASFGLSCTVGKIKGLRNSFPVKVSFEDARFEGARDVEFTFAKLETYSHFVRVFHDYRAWLQRQ